MIFQSFRENRTQRVSNSLQKTRLANLSQTCSLFTHTQLFQSWSTECIPTWCLSLIAFTPPVQSFTNAFRIGCFVFFHLSFSFPSWALRFPPEPSDAAFRVSSPPHADCNSPIILTPNLSDVTSNQVIWIHPGCVLFLDEVIRECTEEEIRQDEGLERGRGKFPWQQEPADKLNMADDLRT